jgi:hypothetical protein
VYKEVSTGSFKVYYSIYEHETDSEYKYDWVLSNGDESDQLFRTVEEAIEDVEARLA